ncbi:hypothetical protein [Streptomyces sp. NPDC002851]
MSAPEREAKTQALSMSELLASCAAAHAVSTPPSRPEPRSKVPAVPVPPKEKPHRDAA